MLIVGANNAFASPMTNLLAICDACRPFENRLQLTPFQESLPLVLAFLFSQVRIHSDRPWALAKAFLTHEIPRVAGF
jgi:hypothetical protein